MRTGSGWSLPPPQEQTTSTGRCDACGCPFRVAHAHTGIMRWLKARLSREDDKARWALLYPALYSPHLLLACSDACFRAMSEHYYFRSVLWDAQPAPNKETPWTP